MPEDPENGNVRLVLQGGDMWQTTWELLDSALGEWEELRSGGLKFDLGFASLSL